MGTLTPESVWHDEIYAVDLETPVEGGPPIFSGNVPISGFANAAPKQLADNIVWLRDNYPQINASKNTFLAGEDFSPGITQTIGLDVDPVVKSNVSVYFDGLYQQQTEYSVQDSSIIFNEVIPENVEQVEVYVLTPVPSAWVNQQAIDASIAAQESSGIALGAAERAEDAAERAEDVADLAQASSNTVWRETLAGLQAVTDRPANTPGAVTSDLNPSNNGYYLWNGSSWVWTGLQPMTMAKVVDTMRVSEIVNVDSPPERGYAAFQNGAVAYPAGATGSNISGLTIPAGQTGAVSYAFLLEYVDEKIRQELAGATLRFHFIYSASSGFLAAKPLNPGPVFRHALDGGTSGIGAATLVSETQQGTVLTRVVDYVVPANVTSWGPHLQIATNAAAADTDHFVSLDHFSWSVVAMPAGSEKSILDAQLEFRLSGIDQNKAQIADLTRMYEGTRTNLQVYDKSLPDRGYGLLRNGAVYYPIGATQPNVSGVAVPSGQTARTTYAFVLEYADPNIVAALSGATLRFTFEYEASAGFLAAFPLRQDAVFRHVLDGGTSAVAPSTLVSETQQGTVLTRVVDYVVPSNVTSWGPHIEITNTAQASAQDHYVALRSFRCVLQALPPGSTKTVMDAQIDLKIAQVDINPESDAGTRTFFPMLYLDEVDTVLGDEFQFELPKFTVKKLGQNIASSATTLSVPETGTEAVVDLPISLIYSATVSATPGTRLPHQYVSNVVVTRVSDGATLVEGVDYRIKPNTGYIYGVQNLPAFACTISYTGHMHRYDAVVIDEASGAVSVIEGTERAIDPEEYPPVVPSGKLLAQTLYVYQHGVDRLQSWRFDGYRDKLGARAYDDWYAYCRSCLPKTFQKLRNGDPLRVIGYGSSSVAMGGGISTQLTPNVSRDRKQFFTRIPADTLALYPSYDGSDPDFAGSSFTDHTKIGFVWQMVTAMRRKYSSAITYRNWGVGGSSSEATIQSNGVMNGLYPDRLNAMLADEGDLMVLAFANGIGASWQYDNTKAIIEAFQATGGEVIVVTPQRLNIYGGASPGDVTWLRTHDDIVRAAIDTGAAFCSAGMISAPGVEGACGVSPHNMTNGNMYNHDGPLRLIQTGELLGSIFEDYAGMWRRPTAEQRRARS